MWLLALACQDPTEPTTPPTGPSDLGGPVGVRTETLPSGGSVEIWYPAVESDAAPESIDYTDYIPASVTDVVGPIDLPLVPTPAVRDAELAGGPWPVVVFSHGFGGVRVQSADLTSHVASHGYVVVSTDHFGRSLPDLLPCLFVPPLEGCVLSFDDAGPDDVTEMLDWLAAPPAWLEGAVDLESLGIMGHSAGAGTTVTVANADDRFDVALPLAGGDALTRDIPVLRMAGTCDGIIPADVTNAAYEAGPPQEVNVEILGAGHLAFADLCAAEFASVGEDVLAGRDDVNELFLDQLLQLGADGCPGSAPAPDLALCESDTFLDLEVSAPIVRHYARVALDAALKGEGPGAEAGLYSEARVTRRSE